MGLQNGCQNEQVVASQRWSLVQIQLKIKFIHTFRMITSTKRIDDSIPLLQHFEKPKLNDVLYKVSNLKMTNLRRESLTSIQFLNFEDH